MKYFYLYGYFLPFLVSFIPALTDDYGPSGIYCWIHAYDNNKARNLVYRLLMFYIPLWIAIIFNFYCYIRVLLFLRSVVSHDSPEIKIVKKLMLYPLILVFCWVWGSFNRIYVFYHTEILWMAACHVFFGGL